MHMTILIIIANPTTIYSQFRINSYGLNIQKLLLLLKLGQYHHSLISALSAVCEINYEGHFLAEQ